MNLPHKERSYSMSDTDSLDSTNSGKITLDEDAGGTKPVAQDFVAIGPGLPCGFVTKPISICEDGEVNVYLFLVRAD